MTVAELKKELEYYDDDMEVVFNLDDPSVEVDSWTEDKEMTREEAIIHIGTLRTVTKDIPKYSGKAIDEALDMAIKALEAPPNDNWEGYSKRLWKSAYEYGKAESEEV